MKFGASYMLIWFWLVPAATVFYFIAERSRRKLMEKFSSSNFLRELTGSFSPAKRNIKHVFVISSIFLIVLSLARPQWGYQTVEVKKKGLDIILALDTSKSMLAEDVLPNRLERAKLGIKDLVKKLQVDRIGLIAFSGNAFLQCPLTTDYDGFLLTLNDVDINTIPLGGTSLSMPVYKALESYEGNRDYEKILILITDGGDLEGGIEGALERAKHAGIRICSVGIGGLEGELIPLTGRSGKTVFAKDPEGNLVKTRLDEEILQKLAIETDGMYVRGTGAEFGLDIIYDEKLSKLEKHELKSRTKKQYFERFQLPLGIALFLLFLEPLIWERRKEKRRKLSADKRV